MKRGMNLKMLNKVHGTNIKRPFPTIEVIVISGMVIGIFILMIKAI